MVGPLDSLAAWSASCVVAGLRIAPVFAFATPFALTRSPRTFRILFGLGVAICLVSAFPANTMVPDLRLSTLCACAAKELLLGGVITLAFQLVFGAIYFAGRTIDIQAGFGFAVLVDPATRSQSPLVGTLFAYAAAAVFFSFDGHLELLRMLAASFEAIPLGTWNLPHSPDRVAAFMSMAFLVAIGIAGAAILAMFLIDMVVAILSRTVPQMSVLILGFQLKTIVLLLVLPASFGIAGALFARLMAMTLQGIPKLL